METNEVLRKQIFGIIGNQLRANNPPETKATLIRLKKEGFNDFQTRQLIGQCVVVEIFDSIKNRKPFNEKRYIKNLKALPKNPVDELFE